MPKYTLQTIKILEEDLLNYKEESDKYQELEKILKSLNNLDFLYHLLSYLTNKYDYIIKERVIYHQDYYSFIFKDKNDFKDYPFEYKKKAIYNLDKSVGRLKKINGDIFLGYYNNTKYMALSIPKYLYDRNVDIEWILSKYI